MSNNKCWSVGRCSRPQAGGDFYAYRIVLLDGSNSHFEHLRDESGALRQFSSEAEAIEAIDAINKATGGQP